MTEGKPPKSATTLEPILIWGAAGHAAVVADTVTAQGEFQVAAFVVDEGFHRPDAFLQRPVLSPEGALRKFRSNLLRYAFVAIGDNEARTQIAEQLSGFGFAIPPIIHPTAVVSPRARLADGVFVSAGAIIHANVDLEDQAIVNSGAIVEHDCCIRKAAHIGPGACMGGHVIIGEQSFVGCNAAIRDRIQVGSKCIVGAGAVVVADLPSGVVAYGNPARVERPNICG